MLLSKIPVCSELIELRANPFDNHMRAITLRFREDDDRDNLGRKRQLFQYS